MPDGECRIKLGAVRGIGDKTRWTKALGQAATVVYGDCNANRWVQRIQTDMGDAVIREALRGDLP